jgi:hypothetical protein
MKARLRRTTLAVALGLSASSAYAMTPLDQTGRGDPGYQDLIRSDVRTREFQDTRLLESSGRGSALDQAGSSAANEPTRDGPARDLSRTESRFTPTAQSESSSPVISDQAAANQDAHDWPVASSEVAGSGYTQGISANTGPGAAARARLVVIVPEDWNGSVPELLAALEQSDEPAVVVMDGRPSSGGAVEVPPSNFE